MEWTEITITVPCERTDEAAAIANMSVPYGIYIEDYSDLETAAWEIAHIDLIDEELTAKDRTKSLIHIYISECDNAAEAVTFLNERLIAAGIPAEIQSLGVNDADWNENWKKYFKAFEVGDRLAVCPSWETYENRENRMVLQIDPGAAFGTGTHATTSLCMEILDQIIRPDDTVLDIGCGSGILAITALLLGAKEAVGVDIDAQSVKTARENAEINGVTKRTDFRVGDLAEQVNGRYNVICANIVADVILRLFETVDRYLQPDGELIVSGIIDLRAEEIEAAAEHFGFTVIEKRTRENWCAYRLKSRTTDE